MIVMSHCEPTLSRFSILMLNNVVERTSRCFWISHHVPESAVAVLAAKKSAPLELRNDFLRERIEVYGHDRETDHETEIGRASWRKRVGQYVDVSLDSVYCKKK